MARTKEFNLSEYITLKLKWDKTPKLQFASDAQYQFSLRPDPPIMMDVTNDKARANLPPPRLRGRHCWCRTRPNKDEIIDARSKMLGEADGLWPNDQTQGRLHVCSKSV